MASIAITIKWTDRTAGLKRELTHLVAKGLLAAAKRGHKLYADAVSEHQDVNSPTGPFLGPSSSPGEYPYMDTTQGFRNVTSEIRPDHRAAAFGVMGPDTGFLLDPEYHEVAGGLHLIWLTSKGRLGPEDILKRRPEEFVRAFQSGAK